jgi:hypothetical protein
MPVKSDKADKSGTLPLVAEMGWRRTVATIRMQVQQQLRHLCQYLQ